METSGFVEHLSRADAVFSDGPDTNAQNHDRSYRCIPENLHLPSLHRSYSPDYISRRSLIAIALRSFSAKL